MPFLNIFKKKRKEKIKKEAKPAPRVKKEKEIKEKKSDTITSLQAKRKEIIEEAYHILKIPHVTEKATNLNQRNQYIFRVWPKANKTNIKKTIKNLYGVDVLSVKIINTPPKKRRLGRISGWRKGYKKAIVKIKEGQKIDVLAR